MAISISGISDLGHIVSESNQITNRVISFTMPTQDTSKAITLNLMGKKREVILQTQFTGTLAQIKAFIDDIEEWINNSSGLTSIQTGRTYTSTFGHTYKMFCTNFQWTYNLESTQKINVLMQLVESLI